MRSALLLAAILVLSLARGAVCKKSQEQMVPDRSHKEVKYSSSWTYPGKVRGNVMGAVLPKAVGRKAEQVDWELPGLSIRGLDFPASIVNSCFHCLRACL